MTTDTKTKLRPIIYSPSGSSRSGEYANKGYALNHYIGCENMCRYCYGPSALHMDRADFTKVRPAPAALERIEADLARLTKNGPLLEPIFLSFATDPYNSLEPGMRLTRQAIQYIHCHNCRICLLTKCPSRAAHDLHLLREGDEFGVSLTFASATDSMIWEPLADTPSQRIAILERAHRKGIRTWASFEPVIYPQQTLSLIKCVANSVDVFKVGKLNHAGRIDERWRSRLPEVDWSELGHDAIALLESIGKPYFIKADLRKELTAEDLAKLGEAGWGKVAR